MIRQLIRQLTYDQASASASASREGWHAVKGGMQSVTSCSQSCPAAHAQLGVVAKLSRLA